MGQMSPNIATRMLQLLGRKNLLYELRVCTKLEVIVVYAHKMQQSTLFTSQLGRLTTRVFQPSLILTRRRLTTNSECKAIFNAESK